MKHIIILLSLLIFGNIGYSQKLMSFSLSGSVKDTSIRKIEILYIKKDKNFSVEKKIIYPQNGRFDFKGKLPYTYAAYLRFNDSVRSSMFFLDNGTQKVFIQSIDSPIIVSGSKSTYEYHHDYLPLFSEVDKYQSHLYNEYDNLYYKTESLSVSVKDSIFQKIYELSATKRHIFYNYVKQHPRSYVALWMLFFNLMEKGYHPVYQNAYYLFPQEYRNNPIGMQIKANLLASRALETGNNFPILNLLEYPDDNKRKVQFNNKYTLVDFWFSHCGSCIVQFTKLTKIYNQYKTKGFKIVSISIDSDIDLWKKTIKKFNLKWPQFLDIGGQQADKLIINSFPTNFLLDSSGKIIKKNIQLFDLTKFLEENCN